jgi:hypothetical protein
MAEPLTMGCIVIYKGIYLDLPNVVIYIGIYLDLCYNNI